MIHVAPIRAAIEAAPGDEVAVSKAQLRQMLDEIETGQGAKAQLRQHKMLDAIGGMMGSAT